MLAELLRLARGRLPSWRARGWVCLHPAESEWAAGRGLGSAAAYLGLPGEIVSGHPSRHVLQVRSGRRTLYLKREHRVRWRDRWANWVAGFGRASQSEREGRLLWALERQGLPAPRCVAFGEDGRGRAFILIEAAEGRADVRELLADGLVNAPALAARVGGALARVHGAGFDHPDLYAKHVLVDPGTLDCTFLDWQRSGRFERLSWPRRVRSLAALHATVADGLASRTTRLRLFHAYLQAAEARRGDAVDRAVFRELVRRIEAESDRLRQRRGVREQCRPLPPEGHQRLVWLDGEALCAVPDVADELDAVPGRAGLYDRQNHRRTWTLPGGRLAKLRVRRAGPSLGRFWSALRGRPWRSPELRQARLLFHLDRSGIAAPRLLAFGQRQSRPFGAVSSFLLTEPPAADLLALRPAWEALCREAGPAAPRRRRQLIDSVAELLRRVHECGCSVRHIGPNGEPFAAWQAGNTYRVVLDDFRRLRYCRRVSGTHVLEELRALWLSCYGSVRRADALRFLVRYLRAGRVTPLVRRMLAEV